MTMEPRTDDPFDRALAREHELRATRERKEWALKSSHVGTLQVLAMLLVPLPLHLWLVNWDKTMSVTIHLIAITSWMVIVAITWLGKRSGLPPET
jgi:hypothetical protein